MNRSLALLLATPLATLCLVGSATSVFAADVGVSITVGEPGFYGRIDIGNVPRPLLIYERPIIIESQTYVVQPQPIYLHVPPGHAKKWSKHCGKYNACGQRVYFVQDSWYSNVYVPYYRNQKSNGGGKGNEGQRGRNDDDGNNNGGNNGGNNGKGHGKDKKDKKEK